MARRPGHASCRGREWWTVCRPERGVVCHRVLAAAEYHQAVQQGGAMIALRIPSGNVDRAAAEQILSKYGAANVNSYGGATA